MKCLFQDWNFHHYLNSNSGNHKSFSEIFRKNDLKDLFQKRCQNIVDDTSGIGWGFHDTLFEFYNDAFEILI